jgi:hypothetical protein
VSRISELVGVHGWPWWTDCSRKSEGSDIDTGFLLVRQYVSDLVRVFKHSSFFSYETLQTSTEVYYMMIDEQVMLS